MINQSKRSVPLVLLIYIVILCMIPPKKGIIKHLIYATEPFQLSLLLPILISLEVEKS